MTTLDDLLQSLKDSELSQVFNPSVDDTDLTASQVRQLTQSIELGLVALYRRFRLRDGSAILETSPARSVYKLDAKYAVSNDASLELDRYILDDRGRAYEDDALRIEQVVNAHGVELPLNDHTYDGMRAHRLDLEFEPTQTLTTPDLTTLWVPSDVELGNLTVHYRAKHPKWDLDEAVADPTSVVVELPQTYWQALFYFVASRVYNPMYRAGEMHEGNNWLQRYEMECSRLEIDHVVISSEYDDDDLFRRQGWV